MNFQDNISHSSRMRNDELPERQSACMPSTSSDFSRSPSCWLGPGLGSDAASTWVPAVSLASRGRRCEVEQATLHYIHHKYTHNKQMIMPQRYIHAAYSQRNFCTYDASGSEHANTKIQSLLSLALSLLTVIFLLRTFCYTAGSQVTLVQDSCTFHLKSGQCITHVLFLSQNSAIHFLQAFTK